jgi:hypothetical protein
VSGELHSFEGEEGVSVDVVLRSSGEAQVSQAEGVHHVHLVDLGAQLGRAAQSTGHAVVPVEITVVLHIGLPAEEGRQHDLAGGGRRVEADGAQHGALAQREEGHKVVELISVAVIRQDRGPQVAVTADVDISLAVLAGVLDERGPKHRFEAVEVGKAVEEFGALSRLRVVGMLVREPMLRTLEIGPGGVPVALGVEEGCRTASPASWSGSWHTPASRPC